MKYFSFKKFDLQVSEEVFPITTDTILLASWVNCKLAKSLLEVGIGSGAISFLLESQNKTLDKVIGIDINKTAIELARQNTLQLKLDKMVFHQSDFQSFGSSCKFDHIVCNPPYFKNMLLSKEKLKQEAKHQIHFDFVEFAFFCNSNLNPQGRVSMIIPTEQENFLAECFNRAKFQLSRLCSVYHEMESESKLSMVEYSNDMQVLEKSSLIMYQNKNGLKTKEFEAMTYNFLR